MINLTIQCPSCGRNLVHGDKLLGRLEGRRGTTRCPCCRDRIHFDATGPALRITFPDLQGVLEDESLRLIARETVTPPEVSEDRTSRIATKGDTTEQEVPEQPLQAPPLPTGTWFDLTPTGELSLTETLDGDVVIPLVQRKHA